jgi:hypothetical protein
MGRGPQAILLRFRGPHLGDQVGAVLAHPPVPAFQIPRGGQGATLGCYPLSLMLQIAEGIPRRLERVLAGQQRAFRLGHRGIAGQEDPESDSVEQIARFCCIRVGDVYGVHRDTR